jgi:hypothetical protein
MAGDREVSTGIRVLADGSWHVGGLPVVHPVTLTYLKRHLVFDDDGPFLAEGPRRLPVRIEGPPFRVMSLTVDPGRETVLAVLDDGTQEPVANGDLGMDEATGRFECLVRGGRARAVLSRAAHQALIDYVENDGGRFVLRVGKRRFPIAS